MTSETISPEPGTTEVAPERPKTGQRALTGNIRLDNRTFTVHDTEHTGPAMFWSYRDGEGRPQSKLLAGFQITGVRHRRHIDLDGTDFDLYTVTTDDGQRHRTFVVTGVDLASTPALKAAFAAAGPIASWPGGSDHEGGVLPQLGSVLRSPHWGATVTSVETLGRIHHDGREFFALPGTTIGADGPTEQPCYLPQRPNTGAARVAVKVNPAADLPALLAAHLHAALAADPSPHDVQTATLLGWGAATCFASKSIGTKLVGGHPLLWNAGPPESGKTERGSRVLTPFGVDPHNLAGSFATTAQLRDCLSATIDVPQMRDEVKLAYLAPPLRADLPRMLKLAYNGQAVEVGGRYASAAFRQQSIPLCPTAAFNSEGSPPQDQAVLDRLVVLPWQRLGTLPDDVRRRVAEGFTALKDAVDGGRMAPVAAAWFSYATRTDLSRALYQARKRLAGHHPTLGARQRSNLESVLAGLYTYADFCDGIAPATSHTIRQLAERFATHGVPLLGDELKSRQTSTGAIGVLQWLAVLSDGTTTHAPRNGSQYRLETAGLAINGMKVMACMREHAQTIGAPLPDDFELMQEIRSWTGVVSLGKKRDATAGRTRSPIAYWLIPWDTLTQLGGPIRADFSGPGRSFE